MDASSEMQGGRDVILARIKNRANNIYPQGAQVPKKLALLYSNFAPGVFGLAESMRCPYYAPTTGQCRIWKYREAVCTTFFCGHVRKVDGANFWNAVRDFMKLVERKLSNYAIEILAKELLSAEPEPHKGLSVADLDDLPMDRDQYRERWKGWSGKEDQFFMECGKLVSTLDSKKFEEILEHDGKQELRKVEEMYREMMAPTVPPKLKINPDLRVTHNEDGTIILERKTQLIGGVSLPPDMFNFVKSFDGKDVNQIVINRFTSKFGFEVEPEVIQELYMQRILIAPES